MVTPLQDASRFRSGGSYIGQRQDSHLAEFGLGSGHRVSLPPGALGEHQRSPAGVGGRSSANVPLDFRVAHNVGSSAATSSSGHIGPVSSAFAAGRQHWPRRRRIVLWCLNAWPVSIPQNVALVEEEQRDGRTCFFGSRQQWTRVLGRRVPHCAETVRTRTY